MTKNHSAMPQWTRRSFLQTCGALGGALAVNNLMLPLSGRAAGAVDDEHYFILCYFNGGWDQLLALDPRDRTLPAFQRDAAYQPNGSGIYPGYELITDAQTVALLAKNPSGIQTVANSPLSFGPAVPSQFLSHASDFSLLRGVNMGTLTHEVGRRYFITGRVPRGLTAAGSALPTAVAALSKHSPDIPNMTIGVETYNESFPAHATGIRVSNATDVQNILQLLGSPLSTQTKSALAQYELTADGCREQLLNGDGLVTIYREGRKKGREIAVSTAATHFAFQTDPAQQSAEIKQLFAAFQISTATDLQGPKGAAALAAQTLVHGVSRVVSLPLAYDLDDHNEEWTIAHAPNLRSGFLALSQLISYLKNKTTSTGATYWSRTTLLCFSEFARTPLVNGRNGRDHHLASSCLIAGPGLRRNKVVGSTSQLGMGAQNVNFSTGKTDENATPIHPSDIHATLLKSMGLPYDHINNQSPQVISALLL